jgi:hypothetical protein
MTIEEEIEILRRQLEAKETTAAGLRSEIEGYKHDIFRIRDKFSRQLTRVERKEASVRENRHDWEKEKIAYDSLKLAHEEEVKSHSKALLAHDVLMNRLKKEITLAGTFESIVAKEFVFDKSADQDLESGGDFAQLQADVVKCEAAVSEGRQLLKAAEAAFAALETECDSLERLIPGLEQTKNSAAARRDFKAAGNASKQIKEATARLKECHEELSGEARELKDAALHELVKLEEDLKAVASEKEKKVGKAAMEMVAEEIRRLVETKASVCGSETDRTCIQAVGTFVLNGQIAALVREGSAYGEKYGGWDAIVHELTDACILGTDEPIKSDDGERTTGVAKEPTLESRSLSKRPPDEVDPEIIALFRDATRRIQAAEEALDEAVAREDFETAEELNELLEKIKTEWEAIDLTEAEINIFELDDEEAGPANEAETEGNAAEETQPSDQSEASDAVETKEDEDDDSESSSVSESQGGYESESGTELVDGSANVSDDDCESSSVSESQGWYESESGTELDDDSTYVSHEEDEASEDDAKASEDQAAEEASPTTLFAQSSGKAKECVPKVNDRFRIRVMYERSDENFLGFARPFWFFGTVTKVITNKKPKKSTSEWRPYTLHFKFDDGSKDIGGIGYPAPDVQVLNVDHVTGSAFVEMKDGSRVLAYHRDMTKLAMGDLVDCLYQGGIENGACFRGRVAAIDHDLKTCDVSYFDREVSLLSSIDLHCNVFIVSYGLFLFTFAL